MPVYYKNKVLGNGLSVVAHRFPGNKLATVNLMYKAGSAYELESQAGMAHLFEHLMFSGSRNIPDFDSPLQRAGGESNAFTNNDLTNFYETLPVGNIETAFWLESDRMLDLAWDAQKIAVQKKVVQEEFRETCTEQPFGDLWHRIRELLYPSHPYGWPPIGKSADLIADLSVTEMQAFHKRFYQPKNAWLSIVGDIEEEQVFDLAEQWFGEIPAGVGPAPSLGLVEKSKGGQVDLKSKIPVNALFVAFRMCDRLHPDYYTIDFITDILATGHSARLNQRLLKKKGLFSHIDAFTTGEIGQGLIVIESRLVEGVSHEQAEEAIWAELNLLKTEALQAAELNKLFNKIESAIVFGRTSGANVAYNLSFYDMLGNIDEINEELKKYKEIDSAEIMRVAKKVFVADEAAVIRYHKSIT